MSFIYEGRLNHGELFHVHQLTMKDISDILRLQNEVYEKIANKSQLAQLTEDEYQYILTGNGLMLGTYVNDELIAIRALLVPAEDDPEHLGIDVGLMDKQLSEVIYQEISFVNPDFQGNRLQQTLATLIMEQLAKQSHNYRYVCCTVAPFNIPSLIDKFRQDMYVKALKPKYDNQLRYIFLKDLQQDFPNETIKEQQDVPTDAIEQQQTLLAAGWVGIALKSDGETSTITYVKSK